MSFENISVEGNETSCIPLQCTCRVFRLIPRFAGVFFRVSCVCVYHVCIFV